MSERRNRGSGAISADPLRVIIASTRAMDWAGSTSRMSRSPSTARPWRAALALQLSQSPKLLSVTNRLEPAYAQGRELARIVMLMRDGAAVQEVNSSAVPETPPSGCHAEKGRMPCWEVQRGCLWIDTTGE